MIDLKEITLRYANGRGIFDLNLNVKKGEIFGCLGPNDAGKTTTIRMLMGFIRPNKGNATIAGFNCAKETKAIQKMLGYIPEEMPYFEGMRINEFLNLMANMRGKKVQKNSKIKESLIERFELDTSGKIENMTFEMKQKLGIVVAFMHDPEVLLLDEPGNGIDPMMQTRLIDLILEEKKRGKTIFLSSQSFEEVERTCDRVGIIKEGYLIREDNIIDIKKEETKSFLVKFAKSPNLETLKKYGFGFKKVTDTYLEIFAKGDRIDLLIKILSQEHVLVFNSNVQTIEESFLNYYSKEDKNA
jgi:ABC-2 type transport system ATP-binding protein